MKKKLNETAIINELKTGSAFFRKPSSPTPQKQPLKRAVMQPEKDKVQKDVRKNVRSNEPPDAPTTTTLPAQPAERRSIRHTFDIFAYQLNRLHALQLTAVQKDRPKPKLGNMVKKALDDYLQKMEQ